MSSPFNSQLQLYLWRLRNLYRDPTAVFWAVLFPIMLSLVLGVAFRSQGAGTVSVAVLPCADRARLAHDLGAAGLEVIELDDADAARALRSGRVGLAVQRDAASAPVRFTFDATRPESRLARALAHDALERGAGRTDLVAIDEHATVAQGSRYIDFLIPGLLGLNLLTGGLWGVGFQLVDQRTRNLLRRMAATPMNRGQFLGSFMLLRLTLVCIEVPALAGFGAVAFGVPMRGSFLAFALTILVGALSFAAIGLLIASRANQNHTVAGLINFVNVPIMLGSGVFFAIERFPASVQPVLSSLPLGAFIQALRAIMLDGAGLAAVAGKLAIVGGTGVACFALALALFRWR